KGKSSLEYRILPHRKGDEAISLYVDELILGPKTERARPIFSLGTESKFCFLREKTLFVNLSGELLYRTGNAGEIMDGIELFKKNIFKSFPKVKSVEIFIDGKKILDNFPTFSED
ncbi:MAG: GerMN domain-containing protein, partial [Treponemataceae bacterium]|nr:GerMN domain-containing protein [Treponemataceae bacterium]